MPSFTTVSLNRHHNSKGGTTESATLPQENLHPEGVFFAKQGNSGSSRSPQTIRNLSFTELGEYAIMKKILRAFCPKEEEQKKWMDKPYRF